MNSYNKNDLYRLNASYGGGWIKIVDSVSESPRFRLIPTGDCTLNGRIYVAVPTDKVLTAEDKRRLNIM